MTGVTGRRAAPSLSQLVEGAPRHVFFTGKGGVGKTSLSCATAVALQDAGKRVLLVSTDPASNLDEVLVCRLGRGPRRIPGAPRLFAINIDPIAAAATYREKTIQPLRRILPASALKGMEEQLSGACTVEIAAFNEFAALLSRNGPSKGFDHVLFDTAPTGHTLRLLSLAKEWNGFAETSTHGTSCVGPLAGTSEQRALFEAAERALRSSTETALILVSRPDGSALSEADRTRGELRGLGIPTKWLVINGIFEARGSRDPTARALSSQSRKAVENLPTGLRDLPRIELPLLASSLIGVTALRSLSKPETSLTGPRPPVLGRPSLPPPLASLIGELDSQGSGVIMAMGKGGVGKTTIASTIAVELARRGRSVLLTTTDPAGHVNAALTQNLPSLRLSRIDGAVETARYTQEVLDTVGQGLDPASLDLLKEDLRSPCTEEVAVFRAFAGIVAQGEGGFVVVDTAPTGHTLLLLDAAQSYHREVARRLGEHPEAIVNLLSRLQDPEYTRILLVALPQPTPVHEAEALQSDLERAGIHPFAWVINGSFLATGTADPRLASSAERERSLIEVVQRRLASRCALVPWLAKQTGGGPDLEAILGGIVGPNRGHRHSRSLRASAREGLVSAP